MNKELVQVKLELIAAKAKALAIELQHGKLWEGDLERGVSEIAATARDLSTSVERR